MKRLAMLFLLCALPAAAQQTNAAQGIYWTPIVGSGSPTLTCQATYGGPSTATYGQPYLNTATSPYTEYRCTASGWQTPSSGVSSINSTTGAFTFTGSGVSCTGTTCTFSGGGGSLPSCTADQLLYYASSGTTGTCLTLGTNLSITSGTLNAAGGGGGGDTTALTPIITPTSSTLSQPFGYYHFQIPYTAVECSSTTCDVELATVPQGFILTGITVVETTPFAGPAGLTAGTVSFGQGVSSPSGFMTPRAIFQAANTTNQDGGEVSMSFTSAGTALTAEFINTTASSPVNWGSGSATSLTAGLLDIYLRYTVEQ